MDQQKLTEARALEKHLAEAGVEHLTEPMLAEAVSRGLSGFVIAARIERALRNATRKPEHAPRGDGWFWRVSGLATRAQVRPAGEGRRHGAARDSSTGIKALPSETPRLSPADRTAREATAQDPTPQRQSEPPKKPPLRTDAGFLQQLESQLQSLARVRRLR